MADETQESQAVQEVPGAFLSTLIRTNTKIKRDRAVAISEDVQMTYKRKVEDLEIVDGGNGKWFVASGDRQLTNVYYGERQI